MCRVLITGASGFVGGGLCDALRIRNIDFIPVVRRNAASGQFGVEDITEETRWDNVLGDCDTVIHLAARVHVMKDRNSNPLSAYRKANVDATINLAQQAAKLGVKRFIFVSSVKVNGEGTSEKPFSVFDEPAPLDPYGKSKLEAEVALQELSHITGLEVVIIRPPLIYGPGVRANFLRLMQLVKTGMPLPFGAIRNRRSMVALDNLVDLLIVCIRHPAAAGHIFMVSDDNDISICELLRMLATAMGIRSLLLPIPAQLITGVASLIGKSATANRMLSSLQVDISHTKSTLGWQPVVTMQNSLDKTVAYFLVHNQ